MPDDDIQNSVIRHARSDMARVPDASHMPDSRYADNWELTKALGMGVLKAVGQAVDRLIPQGRDELANALFNGSAYWPGEQPRSLTPPPPPPPSPGVHGAPNPEAMPLPSQDQTDQQEHNGPYGMSYRDRLDQGASRGGNQSEGPTR